MTTLGIIVILGIAAVVYAVAVSMWDRSRGRRIERDLRDQERRRREL